MNLALVFRSSLLIILSLSKEMALVFSGAGNKSFKQYSGLKTLESFYLTFHRADCIRSVFALFPALTE